MTIGCAPPQMPVELRLPSLGNDFLQENRALPRRSTAWVEELEHPSELDLPESSDSLSSDDEAESTSIASCCEPWTFRDSSISRSMSLARSSAVYAHLSALGLAGAVLDKTGVTTDKTLAEQNSELDGIVIGGGML